VIARPSAAQLWFRSYIQTYLERDVRTVSEIRDLSTFRRFLSLLALRCGQMLHKTDLAAPLGVSVPTISAWLSILETTVQIILIPFYENFGKRLVKSPKLYLVDSGLACHLLGITSDRELNRSPFLGALFEGFVASEIVRQQLNEGQREEVYCFRDQQGLEVDLVVPRGNRALTLLEIKASRTVIPSMAEPVVRLRRAMRQYDVTSLVVHRRASDGEDTATVREGVRAVSLEQLLSVLTRSRRRRRSRSPSEEQRR